MIVREVFLREGLTFRSDKGERFEFQAWGPIIKKNGEAGTQKGEWRQEFETEGVE